jgi:hypothetical protein
MNLQTATDYTVRLAKDLGYGLAVHKASRETGYTKTELQQELNKRRRSKKR